MPYPRLAPGFRALFLFLIATGVACLPAWVGAAPLPPPCRHVPVDQEISLEEVLRLVDPGHPAMREVVAARDAGNLTRARDLLARHMAARERPVVPPTRFPGLGPGNSTLILPGSAADRARVDQTTMRHRFTLRNNDAGTVETYDLGPRIEWMKNPGKALSWILYLNQLNHLAELAGVYRDTRDEKYAAEIVAQLSSWTQQCCRCYGYMRAERMVPSGMEVRNRLCNMVAAYDVVRRSPSLTPDAHLTFWKFFIACARELMRYGGTSYPGLLPLAVIFPEFQESRAWFEAGAANLRAMIVDRTSPEGAWDTHSISYQTVSVPWAARVLEFLDANPGAPGVDELAAMVKRQGGKLLSAPLWVVMPNGGLPNIGDTYGRPDWDGSMAQGFLRSYLAGFTGLPPAEEARLSNIADPYERLLATLAAVSGSDGPVPAVTSVALPGSGWYAMRGGWNRDAAYLYFDLSTQAIGHAHEDACHFDLYAYGKPLLTDTGDYFLGWGYRTALHNTVEVDGRSQARGANAPMIPIEWVTTRDFDFVDGAHGGYGDLGVTYRRKILFVKPGYFVLCDLLTGTGRHLLEQFFHFAGPAQTLPAEVSLDPKTGRARTLHANTANVEVIPAYTAGLRSGFAEAVETDMRVEDQRERKAMLGWMVTTGSFQRVKSPVAVYTREGDLPQAFYDVLFPTPRGGEASVTLRELPVEEDGMALSPHEAAGLEIRCRMARPAPEAESAQMEMGPNLALGKPGFAEISRGQFPEGEKLLTDGDTGPRTISAALSSAPHQPGVPLTGRFGVDFGTPVAVNAVVLHHGIWNGKTILYPAEKMSIQYWDGRAWHDVTGARTSWHDDQVSRTFFDTVRTTRLSVAVERAGGGRLALREFEAYHVSSEELARFERARQARVTEEWTDVILISHRGARARRYGDYLFDGEIALIRKDAAGRVARVGVKTGKSVREGGRTLLESPELLDSFCAEWQGEAVRLDGPAPRGLALLAQNARRKECAGSALAAEPRGGALVVTRAPQAAPPRITEVRVRLEPPQKGLAGAQPFAWVTWKTDVPATSRVEYIAEGQPARRTPVDAALKREHRVRVDFLVPGEEYSFRAISVDAWGQRAEAPATRAD